MIVMNKGQKIRGESIYITHPALGHRYGYNSLGTGGASPLTILSTILVF